MKVIIIDTSGAWMSEVRRALARALPTIEVSEYDADQQGLPPRDFRWGLYHAAILSQELGDQPAGLEWLTQYRDAPGFPPTVLVAAGSDPYLAVEALKRGAADYLRRDDATGDKLPAILSAIARSDTASEQTIPLAAELRLAMASSWSGGEVVAEETGHRFIRLIGQGGYSQVYLAERQSDGVPLVLKVVDLGKVEDPAVLERFKREAEIMESIDDPRVVRVYGHGLTSHYGYISMEFFSGGDLKRRIERGLTVVEAVDIMRGIAQALSVIHHHGIVHRDLKPANLMFRADGGLALADFGISRRLHEAMDLTVMSGTLGTPGYISPEQALGQTLDARADLYSAGVIFYELLTGTKPFRADSPAGLVYQHIHQPPPPLRPELASLQPLLDLLLAKDRAQRFQSAGELLEALDGWLPGSLWHEHTTPVLSVYG